MRKGRTKYEFWPLTSGPSFQRLILVAVPFPPPIMPSSSSALRTPSKTGYFLHISTPRHRPRTARARRTPHLRLHPHFLPLRLRLPMALNLPLLAFVLSNIATCLPLDAELNGAGPDGHSIQARNWSEFFDGALVVVDTHAKALESRGTASWRAEWVGRRPGRHDMHGFRKR
jgi:hypothetical protein